jgi:hemerythrin
MDDEKVPEAEAAYKRFIPAELIEMMGLEGLEEVIPGGYVEKRMTIMFCDIRDFTMHTERMSPRESFGFVNSFMGTMAPVIKSGGGIIDKFIGDAVMAVFPESSDAGVKTAVSMIEALDDLNRTRRTGDRAHIRAGIGLNTGIAMIGAIGGAERMATTVISDAVNLTARLEGLTKLYGAPIIISENSFYSLLEPKKRKIRFLDRIQVKGKSQPQSIYEVFENDPPELADAKESMKAVFEEAAAHYHLKAVDRARELFAECVARAPLDVPAQFYLERCEMFLKTGSHDGTGELDGTIEWRGEFEVGIRTVDAQHMELLRNMNKLAPLLKSGDSGGLDSVFSFLFRYADFHFSHEKELMEQCGYPFIDAHIAEHNRFTDCLLALVEEINSSSRDNLFLIFKTQVFLIDWFAGHSTGMDRHFAIYMQNAPASA